MIVYREQRERAVTASLLDRLECARGIDLLIEMGELEAAVADTLGPEQEAVAAALRQASLDAARGRVDVSGLRALPLPQTLEVPVSEGYAYYAVDPDRYRAAALRYLQERRPARVAVVGIRSIGTSLSAAVAAALAGQGCEIRSWTVRPSGHPWDRRLDPNEQRAREWAALSGWEWAVVDEGPGMSGTSFASVAECLSRLGVSDDRIVLFPAWECDGSGFVSDRARAQWRRHRRYSAGFEFGRDGALDVGGGAWREVTVEGVPWPAVQPQHERRKYLAGGRLFKFAGYGRYGTATLERANELAEVGFSPPVAGLDGGFSESKWLSCRPVAEVNAPLLDRAAAYLAFRRRAFPAKRAVSLTGMVQLNVSEGLGLDAGHVQECPEFPVYPDGRMLRHEWLACGEGYLKADSCDHADDHFFPGPQDIAWDVAAAEVELGAELADRYARASGDWGIGRRLPFYRRAYLAFRLGYTDMASKALEGTEDGRRFNRLRAAYAETLRREL